MEFFEVGGCVRDSLMGVDSKDVDFTVIAPSFEAMKERIEEEGFKIFLEAPQFFTIRAGVPKDHPLRARTNDADFVWARRDSATSDGRRPDAVFPGTLMDDLARRDFTMNAIARVPLTEELIDPFGGELDIANSVIRFVGKPADRIREDGLRVMRGLRFMITKDMELEDATADAMHSDLAVEMLRIVSLERIQIELNKMLDWDLERTMDLLVKDMRRTIFRKPLRLTTSMKKIGHK
jgi:tRNA nucleotidyltransferase/poly(A) polymerase